MFDDTECKADKEHLVDGRNVRAIASGYAEGREYAYYLMRNEKQLKQKYGLDGWRDPTKIDAGEKYVVMQAFDKNQETSWVDIRDKSQRGTRAQALQPVNEFPLWLGIDLGNSPSLSVGCLRLFQDTIFAATELDLQYWDGSMWGQIDYQINRPWSLTGFSGGCWQRWPAAYQTRWRIQNGVPTVASWEVCIILFTGHVGHGVPSSIFPSVSRQYLGRVCYSVFVVVHLPCEIVCFVSCCRDMCRRE